MTVKLLVDWKDPDNGRQYLVGNLLSKGGAIESALVAAKLAQTDLTDGTSWQAPALSETVRTAEVMVGATGLARGFLNVDRTLSGNIAQSGLPFVLPSSGSIGDNGALSGLTALPTTYPASYMYFPAGALYAGSAAGWHYVVMSSTTAGTIYADTYTGGAPEIPQSPAPIVATGPGAYTQTTGAAINALSAIIPGGAMGKHGLLRVKLMVSIKNSAGTKYANISFGGTTPASYSFTTLAAARQIAEVQNQGSVARQAGSYYMGLGSMGNDLTRTTVNTAVDQLAAIQLRIDTASDYIILESGVLEIQGRA